MNLEPVLIAVIGTLVATAVWGAERDIIPVKFLPLKWRDKKGSIAHYATIILVVLLYIEAALNYYEDEEITNNFERLQQRHLTEEQAQKLVELFKPFIGKECVINLAVDSDEITQYALQFENILKKSGCERVDIGRSFNAVHLQDIEVGLLRPTNISDQYIAQLDSLAENIGAMQLLGSNKIAVSQDLLPAYIEINVGSKPPSKN